MNNVPNSWTVCEQRSELIEERNYINYAENCRIRSYMCSYRLCILFFSVGQR